MYCQITLRKSKTRLTSGGLAPGHHWVPIMDPECNFHPNVVIFTNVTAPADAIMREIEGLGASRAPKTYFHACTHIGTKNI